MRNDAFRAEKKAENVIKREKFIKKYRIKSIFRLRNTQNECKLPEKLNYFFAEKNVSIRKRKIKVYFLGSGEFAVPFLDVLANCNTVELIGVGTQPDRPFGRRRQLRPTPVGIYCGSRNINCERIESVSSDEFYARMLGLQPDLLVVVSFGQILRERILEFPRLGCLNVHSSLLPKYRGASPITSMILGGDKIGGVTFMQMDKGLDTGPVFDVFETELGDHFTTQSLEKFLSEESALMLPELISRIAGGLEPTPQDHAKACVTKKIKKSDGSIVWSEDSATVLRKIRAYYPWPGSTFRVSNKGGTMSIKITEARLAEGSGEPGHSLDLGKSWVIACGSGAIEILKLIPEGSREMNAGDYLRGFGGKTEHLEIVLDGPPAAGTI